MKRAAIYNDEIKTKVYNQLVNIYGGRVHKASEHPREQAIYGRDSWPISYLWEKENKVPYPPDFICWPETEKEIVAAIKLCREYKLPLVPYAGGSGVCGGAIPIYGGVTLDLKRMNRVISINDTDLSCTVEPGMNGQLFEEYLNRAGYTLGHFPSSIYCSTVGGWVATRAAGQLSTYYGKIEDMVLSLRVVLGTAEVIETLETPASALGLDYNSFLIGNEGTLGVITSITFKIHPYPAHRTYFAVNANDVGHGIELMRLTMRKGLKPAAVRLYDEIDTMIIGSPDEPSAEGEPVKKKKPSKLKEIMNGIKSGTGLKQILEWAPLTNRAINLALKAMNPGCLLLFTFEGEKEIIEPQTEYLRKMADELNYKILGEGPAKYWWNHRYDVSFNTPAVMRNGAFLDTCEVAATWDKLEKLYDDVKKAIVNDVFIMAHFSHSYHNGNNIYFTFAGYGGNYEQSRQKYFQVWEKIMDVTLSSGAAISHHHSVGFFKSEWLRKQLGNKLPVWEGIKKVCDPDNIMNPGKMGL